MKEHRRSTKENTLEPVFDGDGVQVSSGLDWRGMELPDPVPMAPPVGYKPPDDLLSMIESVIRRRDFEQELERQGFETVEEADDFEVDEDYDPRFEPTIYEEYFEAKSRRARQTALDGAGKATEPPVKRSEGNEPTVVSSDPGASKRVFGGDNSAAAEPAAAAKVK